MNVFMTGASGFVGRNILTKLMAQGHSVKCLARPGAEAALPHSPQVIAVTGDIHNPETFESALRGCDAVIHLVGIISEVKENTFYRVHTLGTLHVVDAMRRHGVRRLIHMSALGTRPGAASRYHQTKYDAEVYVRSSRFEYTIFRPSVIHGPDGEFMHLLRQFAGAPAYPVIGSGKSLLQPIYVEDVAAAFVGALTTPASVGRAYNLGGPKGYSIAEMVEIVRKVMGRSRGRPLHLPYWFMFLQAAGMEIVFPLLGRAPIVNTDQLLMAREDNVCDSSEAQEVFGLTFADFEASVASYLR